MPLLSVGPHGHFPVWFVVAQHVLTFMPLSVLIFTCFFEHEFGEVGSNSAEPFEECGCSSTSRRMQADGLFAAAGHVEDSEGSSFLQHSIHLNGVRGAAAFVAETEDGSFLQMSTKDLKVSRGAAAEVQPSVPAPSVPAVVRKEATKGLHHSMLQKQLSVSKAAAESASPSAELAGPAESSIVSCDNRPEGKLPLRSPAISSQDTAQRGQPSALAAANRGARQPVAVAATTAWHFAFTRRAGTVLAAMLGFGLLQQVGLKSAIMLAL